MRRFFNTCTFGEKPEVKKQSIFLISDMLELVMREVNEVFGKVPCILIFGEF